jgi:hypothetical protein
MLKRLEAMSKALGSLIFGLGAGDADLAAMLFVASQAGARDEEDELYDPDEGEYGDGFDDDD